MDERSIFNIVAMVALILVGIINVFQGLWYMGQERIGAMPKRVRTLGAINIIIGTVAFGFAAMYGFFLLA